MFEPGPGGPGEEEVTKTIPESDTTTSTTEEPGLDSDGQSVGFEIPVQPIPPTETADYGDMSSGGGGSRISEQKSFNHGSKIGSEGKPASEELGDITGAAADTVKEVAKEVDPGIDKIFG